MTLVYVHNRDTVPLSTQTQLLGQRGELKSLFVERYLWPHRTPTPSQLQIPSQPVRNSSKTIYCSLFSKYLVQIKQIKNYYGKEKTCSTTRLSQKVYQRDFCSHIFANESDMLWFNCTLGLNFTSFCFKLNIIHNHICLKTKENKT